MNIDRSVPNHHAHYRGFSGMYGVVAALTMVAGRTATARLAADLTGVGQGDRVVDVGCGPGAAARFAARRGALVTGVDPAPVMRRMARALSRDHDIRWVEGTAEHLPIDDGAATVVWSLATVHHWQDIEQGLAEARRVLAPGGRFLAAERHTKVGATGFASHGWTDAQAASFAESCRAAGFAEAAVSLHRAGRTPTIVVLATGATGDNAGDTGSAE